MNHILFTKMATQLRLLGEGRSAFVHKLFLLIITAVVGVL